MCLLTQKLQKNSQKLILSTQCLRLSTIAIRCFDSCFNDFSTTIIVNIHHNYLEISVVLFPSSSRTFCVQTRNKNFWKLNKSGQFAIQVFSVVVKVFPILIGKKFVSLLNCNKKSTLEIITPQTSRRRSEKFYFRFTSFLRTFDEKIKIEEIFTQNGKWSFKKPFIFYDCSYEGRFFVDEKIWWFDKGSITKDVMVFEGGQNFIKLVVKKIPFVKNTSLFSLTSSPFSTTSSLPPQKVKIFNVKLKCKW